MNVIFLFFFALFVIGGPLYIKAANPLLSDLDLLVKYWWYYLSSLTLCCIVIAVIGGNWLLDQLHMIDREREAYQEEYY